MAIRKGKVTAPAKAAARTAARPPRDVQRSAPHGQNGRAPRAGDVPATCAMLTEVRTELLERMDAQEQRLMAEIHGLKADVARIAFLVEEQNARNKVVLDGLMAYIDRQARLEQRLDGVEHVVRSLASANHPG